MKTLVDQRACFSFRGLLGFWVFWALFESFVGYFAANRPVVGYFDRSHNDAPLHSPE